MDVIVFDSQRAAEFNAAMLNGIDPYTLKLPAAKHTEDNAHRRIPIKGQTARSTHDQKGGGDGY